MEAWHGTKPWRWSRHPGLCGSGALPDQASSALEVVGLKAQGLVSWQFWMGCYAWHPLVAERVLGACWGTAVALQTQQQLLACSWVWR